MRLAISPPHLHPSLNPTPPTPPQHHHQQTQHTEHQSHDSIPIARLHRVCWMSRRMYIYVVFFFIGLCECCLNQIATWGTPNSLESWERATRNTTTTTSVDDATIDNRRRRAHEDAHGVYIYGWTFVLKLQVNIRLTLPIINRATSAPQTPPPPPLPPLAAATVVEVVEERTNVEPTHLTHTITECVSVYLCVSQCSAQLVWMCCGCCSYL